jgi:hypothetical protein
MNTQYKVRYFSNNQWKLADAVSLNAAKSIKKWHEFMNGSKTCQIIKIKGEST